MSSALEGIRQGVFAYLQKDEIRIDLVERTVASAAERPAFAGARGSSRNACRSRTACCARCRRAPPRSPPRPTWTSSCGGVVDAARQATRATAARALLFDAGPDGDLLIAGGEGDGADDLRGRPPGHARKGIALLAAQTDTTIAVEDPEAHPRYSHRCDSVQASPGYVCAPLRHGRVLGALVVAGSERGAFTAEEQEVLGALARQAAVAIDNALEHERSLNFFTHTSNILVSFLEDLDIHLPGHSRGVAALSDMISRRMGLSESERRNIHYGALLHDIGKVRIDHDLLEEPGAPLRGEASGARKAHHPGHGDVEADLALGGDGRDHPRPSRALGRQGLSARPGRRRDPPGRPHRGRGRRVRRDGPGDGLTGRSGASTSSSRSWRPTPAPSSTPRSCACSWRPTVSRAIRGRPRSEGPRRTTGAWPASLVACESPSSTGPRPGGVAGAPGPSIRGPDPSRPPPGPGVDGRRATPWPGSPPRRRRPCRESLARRPDGPPVTMMIGASEAEHPQTLFIKALVVAKREWEATFDAILDPLAILDTTGVVRRANLGFARAVGRSIRDVVTRTCASLLGSSSRGLRRPHRAEPRRLRGAHGGGTLHGPSDHSSGDHLSLARGRREP